MAHRAAVLVGCLLASACNRGGDARVVGAAVRDSAGVRIVESRAPEWMADSGWRIAETPDVSIGTVDGAREYQFTDIRGVIELSDGRIVVADGGSMQLRCYAPDGEFLWASGRRGQGPGEFATFTMVAAYRGDSIFVHDFAQRRFTVVAPNGAFGRTGSLALPPGVTFSGAITVIGAWPDGSIAARKQPVRSGMPSPTVTRRTQTLYRYDPEGNAGAAVDSVPGLEYFESTGGVILPLPFGRGGRFVITNTGAVVADDAAYEFRAVTMAGRVGLVARRAFVTDSIRPGTIAAERERLRAERARWRDTAYRGMPRPMLQMTAAREDLGFSTTPFPPTYPAYGNVLADRDGFVFVQQFVVPGGRSLATERPPAYSVFAPTGEWLGEIAAPRSFTISQVVSGQVLGVLTDEMGVQFVQIHRIVGWPKTVSR